MTCAGGWYEKRRLHEQIDAVGHAGRLRAEVSEASTR